MKLGKCGLPLLEVDAGGLTLHGSEGWFTLERWLPESVHGCMKIN